MADRGPQQSRSAGATNMTRHGPPRLKASTGRRPSPSRGRGETICPPHTHFLLLSLTARQPATQRTREQSPTGSAAT